MIHDLTELGRVGRALSEVLDLLKSEQQRLEQQHGQDRYREGTAGSPRQTLHGIGQLCSGVGDVLKHVALAAGYISLGLDEGADNEVELARMKPVGVPSGVDRMVRPLGESTVRALQILRDLDGFFDTELGLAIEVALAAPQATYPPDDWAAYQRQQRERPE
ncbi:hypothetical protein AB0O76_43740 [Streptomyces sp. NPDC086554]|uniref:hypothetical protein n=1 Tax=Streptomyces sp. NPDC086554 TaxID=3154864 RepID=UPI0034313043